MWPKYHDIYLATILVLKWFDNNLRVHFGIRNGVVGWVGWGGGDQGLSGAQDRWWTRLPTPITITS